VVGALFIAILGNALNLIGVSQFWQLVVKAIVLIAAALIYTNKKS
jgi:ribose transport system permease protein